ncbi:MAG TPA: DUF6765 family protein [Geobacteraceae bacterium]|nr:DUF6765 family protein [Geobacteraceae bacterium]
MQIDFHHAVTYVAARIAGFDHKEADIIAHASQYVDDATCAGVIKFDIKAMYKRINSSHKTIDFDNFNPLEDLLVWMPFHFLPGNGGADPGDNPDGAFIHKLVATPDSQVAREMVQAAILDQDKPYSLHRLGITMHVYADTWAHQGFAGVLHRINELSDFDEIDDSGVFEGGLKGIFDKFVGKTVPPLGHAQANVFPDMPFLSWKYRNGHGDIVDRNNCDIFCRAADALCRAMQEYRRRTFPATPITGIGDEDMKKIRALFMDQKEKDENKRHEAWLRAIKGSDGKAFSFGPATISYAEDGEKSWKSLALGDGADRDAEHVYVYNDSFLSSDWKLFHDALQLHLFTVSHDILPRFGICAA